VANQKRSYLLYIPANYNGQSPVPLVFDFHGTGGYPITEAAYSDSAKLAANKRFVLAAPAGLHKSRGRNSWNTTRDPKSVDDVGLIKEIIKDLTQKLVIDEKRIYATGMSGGARMSSRVACDVSEAFAAVAPVAGIQFPDDCAPSRAMPVITFHGKKDLVNHYVHQSNSRPYWKKGVDDSVAGWVDRNGCEKDPQADQISEVVTKLSWKGCRDGAEVVFYRIEDGGHTWPGSPIVLTAFWAGKTNQDIVATELIWDFFETHPLP
ncbi:MAG: hypothetical protein GY866_36975, partial [Proteobacteria bacterium]|nr:hypothetical protein [Pseudomonadota bacterium]